MNFYLSNLISNNFSPTLSSLKILSFMIPKGGHFLSHIFYVIEYAVPLSWTGTHHLFKFLLNFQVPGQVLYSEWSYAWILLHVRLEASSMIAILGLLKTWFVPNT